MNTYNKETYEQDFPAQGTFNWKTVRLKTPENPYSDGHKILGVVLHDGNFMADGVLFLKDQYEIIDENPIPLRNSDVLKRQAGEEENDLKSLGLYTKAIREERVERFEEYRKKLIEAGYAIQEVPQQSKIIILTDKFGAIHFYPKANNLLITKQNRWIKPGLRWIVKNILS